MATYTTQFAEDAAHTSGDIGTMALGVRKDTAASLAGTDGDYEPPIFDATGRQWVNSELPDAAALADNTANPTAPAVGSFGHVWDGSTWDRAPGTAADGTLVNLGANNDVTVTSGLISTKTALTETAPTFATVGVTSAAAVSAAAGRKGLILTNTSSATISLAFDAAAVLNSGITLPPWGVFVMDEYSFTVGEVRAIASVAASNLAVQEFTT